MNLKLEILTEDHAKQICCWKYEGIYSIYNYPDWDTLTQQRWWITIEEKRKNEFTAVIGKSNNLCGYIRFVENKDFVLVGLGLKPSSCGQGLGNMLMGLLKSECKKRHGSKKVALVGSDEFIKMEYKW